MGVSVLTDASVTYNSVDLSDWVRSVTVNMSSEDVDLTGMGATSRVHRPGLRDDFIEVTFLQDHAGSAVDQTIYAYVGSSTGATLVVKPTSSAVSSTNPSYTMTAAPLEYQPVTGTVGEPYETTVRFVNLAATGITRATS